MMWCFLSKIEGSEDSAESLYVYENVYSLIPKFVSLLARLQMLKFFQNEIKLFAPKFGNLKALECLQMKISSSGIGGLPLHTLKGLKELKLSKCPPRPSTFPILTEISDSPESIERLYNQISMPLCPLFSSLDKHFILLTIFNEF
ncbi:hypothetical protein VNO78_03872 [Psophocarpus tetragonolobus]|uniref:Uncharacterized protein n=1 Tax=Psophocarpus tetragonolobus TaxID=3891 RepID=A0AAN9XWG6_PSOTE